MFIVLHFFHGYTRRGVSMKKLFCDKASNKSQAKIAAQLWLSSKWPSFDIVNRNKRRLPVL